MPRGIFIAVTALAALICLGIALTLFRSLNGNESTLVFFGTFLCAGVGLGCLSFAIGRGVEWLREFLESRSER